VQRITFQNLSRQMNWFIKFKKTSRQRERRWPMIDGRWQTWCDAL
jgi:hypothetical protein